MIRCSQTCRQYVWTGHQRFPASPTQMLAAANNAIACNRHTVAISATTALTLTSVPTVLNGSDGQICVITNIGTNSVTLQREDMLASSNLQLSHGEGNDTPQRAGDFTV